MKTPPVDIPPNPRILVIDDNASIHEDFRKILSPRVRALEQSIASLEAAVFGEAESPPPVPQAAFEIHSAFQGAEGIECARSALEAGQPYAMAFVDVRMPPGLDGIETTERLWATDRGLQVVICTAFSDYSWEEMIRRLGPTDNLVILKKPFDSVEVLQLAHALTEKWRLQRALQRQLDQLESLVDARTAELRAEIAVRLTAEAEVHRAKLAAEEASRAKTAFLANMSHEIRTPMNAVLGMCQLLLDSNLSPEQRDLAETLNNSSEALLSLLNDVLDISKIEADRMVLEQTPFYLQELVDGAVQMFAGKADEKGLELVAEVDPACTSLLVGDPARLRQILLNLLSNAIKFTTHGEVSLFVRQTFVDADRVDLQFVVHDTGIGIATEDQPRLFSAFIQADSSITRRFGRTGLGLAICKRLVELMNGTIDVDSTPGVGSTFTLRIGFPRSHSLTPPPSQPSATPDLAGRRVLVVDDCATNRKLVRHLIEAWSGTVEEASSPTAVPALVATQHAAGQPFAVVLLDYHMPEMDGLALASQIRKLAGPHLPPLLLLTSQADRPARQELDALGIRNCLLKPLRKQQLAESIAAIVGAALPTSPSPVTPPAPSPPPDLPTPTPPAQPSPPLPRIRVLVAEDNPVNQKVALLHLQRLGFHGDVANNGLEAIHAISSKAYDLVLMDCQMPELDGMAATRRIRERETGTGRHLPIVAMTGGTVLGDRELCLAAGMDDYIAKPVRWAELRTIVQRHLPHLAEFASAASLSDFPKPGPVRDPWNPLPPQVHSLLNLSPAGPML